MEQFQPLRMLHITISIGETSAPYNEHCLPMVRERQIAICTYFPAKITPPPEIKLFAGDGSVFGFYRALRAALTHQPYDVIHVHAVHVALLYLLGRALMFKNSQAATVYTVHTSYPTYELRHRLMSIPVFAFFQRVVCCSQASYASFPAFYKWLAGDRLCAVPNGLDIGRVDRIIAKSQRPALAQADFRLLAVSRLVEIKNPFVILDAFQQSCEPGSRLVFVGDGPLQPGLVAKSTEGGMPEQVEFLGLLPREQVFPQLLNADLFISTSHGEGLPVSVLEAMACRCPVLLSDIPSHREIAAGVDFIPLVSPNDSAGFARVIQQFRALSAAERVAIGQKCRKLVEERFSLATMHAGYSAVYGQLLGNNPATLVEAR